MEPTKKVYKILIVDDDVDIIEIIRETFAADHCTIYTAPDGVQAHRLILAEKFDAIITDIMMPRLNGLDLVPIIKETPGNRAAHIFVMSGFLNNERIAMLAALKVVNIIVKPFEAAALRNAVMAKIKPKAHQGYEAPIISAFASAVSEVAEFYLKEKPKFGKPYLKTEAASQGLVSALISFNQNEVHGSLCLSCDADFISGLAKSLFPDQKEALSAENCSDIAGETANQIVGKVKINLAKLGFDINIGLPKVIYGEKHVVSHKTPHPVLVLPAVCAGSKFFTEFTISDVLKKRESGTDEPQLAANAVLLFD